VVGTGFRGIAAITMLAATASPAAGRPDNIVDRAVRYLRAQEHVMQRGASMADVDRLMGFYAPNYVYRDAKVGITVAGIEAVRRGSASHLRETADAAVRVDGAVASGDTVALKVRTSFTLAASGKRVQRSNLVVLHYSGGKIAERIDF
jgi:ketosteroid isomerase-like protein